MGCRLWGCTELDTTESDLAAAAAAGLILIGELEETVENMPHLSYLWKETGIFIHQLPSETGCKLLLGGNYL